MIRAARKQAEELARGVDSGTPGRSDQELTLVFQLITDDFNPGRAPVERIMARAAEKALKQPVAAARRPTRGRLWRPAIITVAVIMLGTLSIVSRPTAPGAGAIVTKALSAIEEPGKITYYKIVTRSKVGPPAALEDRPREITEHWVDYENETQKVVTSSSRKGDVFATLTKDGKTIGIEGRGSDIDVSESRAIQPFSDRLKDEIGNYRAWLREGARRLGNETVNGIETYKIQLEQPLEDMGRVDGRKLKDILTMNVRRDNFYPVRITNERYLVDAEGRKEIWSSSTQIVEEIKLIDPAALPADLFSLDIPPDAPYHVSYGYTVKEARNFNDFDLYYLGGSFDNLKFEGTFEYENERNAERRIEGWPREMVRVNYVSKPADDNLDVLTILIWPKFRPKIDLTGGDSSLGRKKTIIDIDGKPATLVEFDWGRTASRLLVMERGRSTLQLQAAETDTLIRAAQSLRKVN